MGQGEHLKKNKGLPAYQQLRYLIELEKLGSKRGCVVKIAENCGALHGSVSRYLKICCEEGYLNEDYTFTEKGKNWLSGYKNLISSLEKYLKSAGLEPGKIPETIKNLIEDVDYYTLYLLVNGPEKQNEGRNFRKGNKRGNPYERILEYGNYPVNFKFYRVENGERLNISMADRGFMRPAVLRHNKRMSCLVLRIQEMSAVSRVGQQKMSGHLSSMKYDQDGIFHEVEIKDGYVRLPLDAFRFFVKRNGGIQAVLNVTVTCSVGRIHMPESTARLVVWM